MPTETASDDFRILLVSNYGPDKQYSMQRFAKLLHRGLEQEGIDVELYAPAVFFGKLGARPTGLGKWIGYLDKHLLFPFQLRQKIRSISKPCIVHICDHSNAIYTSSLANIPHLVTCHDLLAIRSAKGEFAAQSVGWSGRLQQQWILSGLKRSRCIVCVSEATQKDLLRHIGRDADPTIIPNALEPSFTESSPQSVELPKPLTEGSDFVLHVGSNAWYKNREAVLRVYERLAHTRPTLQLVVVGPQFTETELTGLRDTNLKQRIHYLAHLSDNELRAVYIHAQLLLFPSLIEGFGWPIIEAQACGCPVATLERPPMSELNASIQLRLPDPEATDNWAAQSAAICEAALNKEPEEQQHEQEHLQRFCRQFELQAITRQYLDLYRRLLKKGNSST